MTTWPKVGQLGSYLDAETGATPLSIMKDAIKTGDASVLDQLPSSLDLFLGNHPDGAGAMGEICALALLIGLAYMLWMKIITWHIPDLNHWNGLRVCWTSAFSESCLRRSVRSHLLGVV